MQNTSTAQIRIREVEECNARISVLCWILWHELAACCGGGTVWALAQGQGGIS